MSLRCVVPLFALGLSVVPGFAFADIYKWEDAAGHVTISDLPPPKGARLIVVIPKGPAPPPVAVGESELRRLSERIQSLEREVKLSARPPPPPPPPAPAEYVLPPQAAACDPRSIDCGTSWPQQYLSGPIAAFPPDFHRHRHGNRQPIGGQPGIIHHGSGMRSH